VTYVPWYVFVLEFVYLGTRTAYLVLYHHFTPWARPKEELRKYLTRQPLRAGPQLIIGIDQGFGEPLNTRACEKKGDIRLKTKN
jgi:hypothetical protein